MARSVWKGPFVDRYLLKKVEEARSAGKNTVIKTWSRRSTILTQFVGLTFGAHKGRTRLTTTISVNTQQHGLITDTVQTKKRNVRN